MRLGPTGDNPVEQFGYMSAMRKYFTFSGRAPRREFWMFVLINVIGAVILYFVDAALFGYNTDFSADTSGFNASGSVNGVFGTIWSLAHFIPGLAVSVRRLHDIGKSGWWVLIAIIPVVNFIGVFVLIYWYIKSGDENANEHGQNPYGLAGVNDDVFA